MKNRFNTKWLLVVSIASLFVLTSVASGTTPQTPTTPSPAPTTGDYIGKLRIYIVEPESRWNMYDGTPYHFGVLGIITTSLDIPSSGSYDHTYSWSGSGISESNIMAQASVFNNTGHQKDSGQGSNPYIAYYVDAAAAATPGNPGQNIVNATYTHTVFIEEATATWCHYCPAMGHALYTVYTGGGYNFYYAALVDDMNSDAHTRLNDYNLYGFPTAFYDGGYAMTLGGDSNPTTYKNGIKNCGRRAVAPLNVSIDMTVDGNSLQIHVVVANMDNPQAPVTPSAPSGPSTGTVGVSYQFTASTTDPQADQISYLFDFGDGTDSGWMGPIASGATATVTHAWSHKGTFNVKVMAKDASGHSSSWSSNHVIVISAPTITLDVKASKGTVVVSVTNPGSQNLSSLTWSIHVHGGLLGFLDKNWNGTIDSLPAGQTTTVNSGKIFGLGPIRCDVLVAGTTVNKQGFVLGPFLIIR